MDLRAPDIATCAKCGAQKELCQTSRSNGIKSPRFCKECAVDAMNTDDWSYNSSFWMKQMGELKDYESIRGLIAKYGKKED